MCVSRLRRLAAADLTGGLASSRPSRQNRVPHSRGLTAAGGLAAVSCGARSGHVESTLSVRCRESRIWRESAVLSEAWRVKTRAASGDGARPHLESELMAAHAAIELVAPGDGDHRQPRELPVHRAHRRSVGAGRTRGGHPAANERNATSPSCSCHRAAFARIVAKTPPAAPNRLLIVEDDKVLADLRAGPRGSRHAGRGRSERRTGGGALRKLSKPLDGARGPEFAGRLRLVAVPSGCARHAVAPPAVVTSAVPVSAAPAAVWVAGYLPKPFSVDISDCVERVCVPESEISPGAATAEVMGERRHD